MDNNELMNLEFTELTHEEQQETEGGFVVAVCAGAAACVIIGAMWTFGY